MVMENRQVVGLAVKKNGTWEVVSLTHPLPVDTSPGSKAATELIDLALIAAAGITTLANCVALDLSAGTPNLALTVYARYNAAAVSGIRVHVRTSPTGQATGTHTAANNPTIMTDAAAHFIVNELIGLTIENITDGSSGVITANTETTVTVAALIGGTLNIWTTADTYRIIGANYDTQDWDVWTPSFVAGTPIRNTRVYETAPAFIKVLVENLDIAQSVTDVMIVATGGA